MMTYTKDEIIAACISHQIPDGQLVAQGIATPLVAAGYLLARLTHAPELAFISAIGQSVCRDWAPLGVATIEKLWISQGLMNINFIEAVCSFIPRFHPIEFFRPGQVDVFGNFNNVHIGGSYKRPRLRLPGVGGIPDLTPSGENIFLYVPRHGRHTFVDKLDFKSGIGHDPTARPGKGPTYLVSDLAQFDFGPENGRMRLTSIHPGVTIGRLRAKTGFDFEIQEPITETVPPTQEELRLLREVIDPLGVRTLETLSGRRRRQKLREILHEETTFFAGFQDS
jgi:glutaconate CoA-transferase subunit B